MKNKILIVASNYYPEITNILIKDSKSVLDKEKFNYKLELVNGVFEIPSVISVATNFYEGFVALGCVVRGETSHYDYICGESARAIMNLSLSGLAIGYGIITVENLEQALARAKTTDSKIGKGKASTEACLSQLKILKNYKDKNIK